MNSINLHDITKIELSKIIKGQVEGQKKPYYTRNVKFYTGSIHGNTGVIEITAFGRMKSSLNIETSV